MLAEQRGKISTWDFRVERTEAEHVPGEVRRSAPAGLQSQEPWAQETGAWIPVPVLGGADG